MTSYAYRIWTEEKMIAYITDPLHEPVQYQTTLEGQEKAEAIDVVTHDKQEAGNDGFYQSTISESERLYLRTSKETGNSWESKFDDEWQEIPWEPTTEPAPKEEYAVELENASVVVRNDAGQITIIIKGQVGDT